MKTVEERLKSYEPLWENWTYSGAFLGEGAMSSVFEIQSSAMGLEEVAALKIITVKKNLRGEVKIPESALNEIKILRDLSGCPNIVQYHDSTQRQIFNESGELSEIDILIKMEKLRPLSESDRLTESEVIRLAKDMCNALIHASEHNIIHRDIKPQNIFVDNEGTYKLGDFGIAKIVSDFSPGYTLNIGTLAYTAPEIHNSTTGVYDISSDIYSLGLVLYVFLNNGQMPFVASSKTLNEAITKRLSGAAFPSPENGSKNLKTIVMRACTADMAKRYKTPAEMLEDLELLSTGGRKLVVDPFATLDANLDISEDAVVDISASHTSTPDKTDKSELKSTSGGLKFSMKKASLDIAKEEPADKASDLKTTDLKTTAGKLKINISSKAKDTSEEVKPKEAIPEKIKAEEIKPEIVAADSKIIKEERVAEKPEPVSRLKINMKSKGKDEPAEKAESSVKADTSKSESIPDDTKKEEVVSPAEKEEAASESKEPKKSSFFSTPTL